jgi:MFS family permease
VTIDTPRPLAARWISFVDPRLPPSVWRVEIGGFLNSFGNGVVLPFVLIYLHNVRGMSLAASGLVLATIGGVSLVANLVAGAVADRVGARGPLVVSLLLLAAGFGLFPLVRAPWHAFALAVVVGVGEGVFWPAQSSLLAALAPERRHAAFALQRVASNLGIGIGGLVGGVIATTADPSTFTVLFLVDAATFGTFVAVLATVPSPAPGPEEPEPGGTYRDALRNRPLVALLAANVAAVVVGYAMLSDILPVHAKNGLRVSEWGIGLVFFVNTIVIVVAQLPIARVLEGRRRMPALAAMGALWAVAWLVVLGSDLSLTGRGALAALAVAAAVVAIGECVHAAVQGALIADLAPPSLLGRYFALFSVSWGLGAAIGPAVGGYLLDLSPRGLWAGCAGLALATGVAALALEPALPEAARRTPARPEAAPDAA